jgi:alpha-tubulin suppressor-like RCC1 family protein
MSALNFPDNPTPGEQYTDPTGKVWTYNGVVWNASINGPTVGATGISGFSGNSGATGTSGFSGQNGIIGTDGATGISGFSGTSGFSGFSGISGYSGVSGATGSGTSGFSGYSGTKPDVVVSDQGSLLTNAVSSFNFVGDLVTATTVGGVVTVTIENPPVYSNTIWSWGGGIRGVLGDNTTVNKSSPVSVVGGFTDWSQVSAGSYSSLAVRQNGTVWAWGRNTCGQLGDNTTVSKSSPVSVIGGFTDWCQVSAGRDLSLGIRQNGTAWGWGRNGDGGGFGQVGDNTTITRSSPVSVVGGFTDWCQVAGAYTHSLGVRQNGTAWAWGQGSLGRLGDNTIVNKSSPVSVVGGFCDWCQVAGYTHSLGVRQNGTAWAWGANNYGKLGDNTTVVRSSPVSVVGGFTDWCQVSAGYRFSLGVRTGGTLYAWGLGSLGQLGTDSTVSRSSPVSVVGGFTDWCQVDAGRAFSLGVRQNGTAWGWGYNAGAQGGRLGDNTTVNRSSPVSVVGCFTDFCQVSAGFNFSLGLRSNIV